MRRPSARRRRRAAFTLMEVLLVVAILLILGSIVVVSFSGIMKGAEEDTTRTQMEAIANGVKAFYARHRTAPTSLQDLVTDPGNTKKPWQKVRESDEVPKNAWGQEIAGSFGQDEFTITSSGPNRAMGDADDIVIKHGY